QPPGRKAIHPSTLLGLIVYGIVNRQWSFREMEGWARRDVGAWWLCGGHQPDHSTIGKIIVLHSEVLTDEVFVTLVKHLAADENRATLTAGEGTIIDGAAGRFRLLRVAAQQALKKMEAQAVAAPEDADLKRKAGPARVGEEQLTRRAYEGKTADCEIFAV